MYDYSPERSEAVAHAMLDSWLSTKHLADIYSAKYLAILQPAAAVGKPKLDYLKIDTIQQVSQKYYYPYVKKLINNDSIYKELKCCFFDLSNSFDIDEYIYFDPGHVTPNGNKIIANKILKILDSIDR